MRTVLAARSFIGAISALLLLASCAAVSTAPADGGPQPTADPSISNELLPFYEQKLSWSACGGEKTYCSTLEVPADWNNLQGDRFKIAVVYRMADSAKPIGSLLFNPGGPGTSGVSWVRDSGDQIGTSALRSNFNIVGFEDRIV